MRGIYSNNKRAVAITGLTYQNQKFGPTIVYKKYDELSFNSTNRYAVYKKS